MTKKNLCVLQLNSPSDEVRGKSKRYFYEIRPNVFVGTVSASVRDLIWQQIEENNIPATLIYSDKTEQGFSFKSTLPEDKFISLDDVLLPITRKSLISVDDLYAKPAKKLIEHLLETGSIAYVLLTEGRGHRSVGVLSKRFNIPEEDLISSICFLCALHDIGKVHPGFFKSLVESSSGLEDVLRKLEDSGMIVDNDENIRHERYSRELVQEYLISQGFDKADAETFAYTLAYHHQNKAGNISESVKKYNKDDERWTEWAAVQNNIIEEISKKWPFSEKMSNAIDSIGINGLIYYILSVIVTSDWIASSDKWEEYLKENDHDINKSVFLFINDNLLSYKPIGDTFKNINWEDVFDYPMNELQKELTKMDLHDTSLLLLEYPCGYGKTVSALLSAVLHFKDLGGMIFTAPTTNTAKALRNTISEYAKKAGLDMTIPEFDSSMAWNEDDEGIIPKDLWVNKSRHQLLYPYAVGTVDQVLKCVLSYRYSCIGMLGLSDKVIIIDETHAYDAYMRKEILELIKWCRLFEIPVILLSATLPTATKKTLFKAAGMKEGQEIKTDYPLISTVNKDGSLVQNMTLCEGRSFRLNIQSVHSDKDINSYMYKEAMSHKEGCLALITSTVDDAFDLYDQICRDKTDCGIILYHSRDTIEHKNIKIESLLDLLGSNKAHRPKKLIVVATSIIEQSLNVDFDRMITAIAPIDLLIQRLGRVWRFSDASTIRESRLISNPFTVVVPENLGVLARVYEEEILNKTADTISKIDKIDTVADIRNLIDTVYDNFVNIGTDMSEIHAGYNCLSDPFFDESIIVSDVQDSYQKFEQKKSQTRESKYETVQVAILKEALKEDFSYQDKCRIMNENVVNVPLYKIQNKGFTEWESSGELFNDLKIFIGGEDLTVEGNSCRMILSKDGLRFI